MRKPSTAHNTTMPWYGRRWPRILTLMATLLGLLLPIMQTSGIYAASLPTASVTGAVTVGGTVYAKTGDALTLTVNTTSDTECVGVTGALTATQTNVNGQSTWTFPFNAGTGADGPQTITATTASKFNKQNVCSGQPTGTGTATASYTLDNTGPTVTGSLSPVPNGAGWNKSNVTITWSATDAGSGIGSGPTPATTSVTAETGGTTKTSTATDKVGNTGTGSVTVKLDETAPTIVGSRSPAANANGWNNTNVTASFTCSDALSGIKTCPSASTLTTEGANRSVTGTAVDVADNNSSATVSGINIDKTPPSLSGAPTTSPNAAGWYNSNVTVAWTCSDALSGIPAGTCPANSTISGEGTGLTASASVSDKAGNMTTATSSPAVNIDKTAPTTTASAPPAWNNTNITVSLNASDALSGVANTFYKLDGGAQQTGTSVLINTEGIHTLQFWSVDKAGNTEATNSVQVKIDKTPPTISHTQSPSANANGWNNTSVTVTFTCADPALADNNPGSGIASCTSPQTVSTEGKNQPVTGTATDNAGNTATDPAKVSIDKTKPTISGAPDRTPNAAGWYNANVTVSFSCADALSGIDTCTTPQTLGEGANQSATGTAVDAAGNSASTTVSGINVDETPPTLTGAATTSANSAGWYNGDVTIHWSCSDPLSGIPTGACPADSTIKGEGANLSASASVSDKAGNPTTTTVGGIKIDRTPPSTTWTPPVGWQNTDVAVSLIATDNLSGVSATYYKLDGGSQQQGNSLTIHADGDHTLQFWSVDNAGNTEATNTVHVKIDQTNPTISHTQSPAPNTHGWNNSDVTVTFQCADQPNLSGLASCTGPQNVTAEGANQLVSGTAVDNAGNSAGDKAFVSIDKTPPTISAAADRSPNGNGWYNANVTVGFTCADSLSGIDSCPAPKTLSEGANQSASGTATDTAGNTASASVSSLNIDKTAPILTGAPTTAANSAGWYNGDVSIAWSCSDPKLADGNDGSGIDGNCPANSTIKGEGAALTASASVNDKAGNTTTADSPAVNIDRTPPTTSASAPSSWVNNNVTVSLSASDALSGVDSTYYILDGGAQKTGTSVVITTEGTHTLEFWSVDKAGNAESHKTIQVLIDKTAPTIAHTQSPAANGNGWNNGDVTVTFICTDPALADGTSSGIASCTSPQTVTTEGAEQPVTGTAKDNAGNEATDPAAVSIDKTPPTISGAPDRPANANGWYNDDVTVNFICADQVALSGIDTCTTPQTLGEGGNQSVTGTAVDAAGNSTSTTVGPINVDKTRPTLTGAAVNADGSPRSPNASGWYNGDVTIHWTCVDALSGIPDGACPPDSTVTGEGNNLSASATVSDKAGNPTNTTVGGIHVDRTAPNTTATAPLGWQNSDVTVVLNASDNLSGVKATYYTLDGGAQQNGTSITISTEGTHTLTFWSVDTADNAETPQSVTVQIDKTPPTIIHTQDPLANANGWNNSDVTVTFQCADQPNLSGLASCTTPQKVTTEGKNQPVPGTALDNAGNSTVDPATVSIDKTPPIISAAVDRAPDNNNWYNADVKVSFICSDALSGIDVCPPTHTLGEGADQSFSDTATDAAGNSASAGVSHLNVDETPPLLSGAPTSQPNGNGWYNGDVTVTWVCSDPQLLDGKPGSGIDGTCPNDSVIASEGDNLSASAAVSDVAGNSRSASVTGIQIDRTPPSTDVSAPSAWVNSNVTVTLTPNDNLSGVDATHYILDNGTQQTGTSLTIATEGTHSLTFWSVDKAGNAEHHKTIQILIDKSNPVITNVQDPQANANGWNNADVTVTFTCTDPDLADGTPGSGIASCTSPQTVTTEGLDEPVTGTAKDNAGNEAIDPATVSIDKTPPTISGAPDRPANANGWYNAEVTVSFTCGDALSGLKDCTAPKALGEGGNQSVTGTATDAAGNSAGANVGSINVDETPPTLTGAAVNADGTSRSPNADGWYNSDVTIHWTCGDALSGIPTGACPADSTVTSEGENLSTTASVIDKADNSTMTTVDGIHIDRTAPKTTATAPTGWQSANVTVVLNASDNLSGVKATYYRLDSGDQQAGTSIPINTEGTHTVTFWSVDKADNAETPQSVTVQIDKTPPTIKDSQDPVANAHGWNNTDVSVSFTCADQANLSGLASCTGPQKVTTEGQDQPVLGTAMDNAGNMATDTAHVNIDKTPPTISAAPDRSPNANNWYNADVSVSFTCGDALSGIDICPAKHSLGEGADQSFSDTATDAAGNTASAGVSHINVDKTPPTLSGAPTSQPNGNGWYNDDVTIAWTCSDPKLSDGNPGSGIDGNCPGDSTITGEGNNLFTSASVSDKAGNQTTANSPAVKIDRTPPSTDVSAPSAWTNNDVTVTLNPTDNLSGVAATNYILDGGSKQTGTSVTITTEGTHTLEFWSVDNAGNAESHKTIQVKIDKTNPIITDSQAPVANAKGWNNTDVTVTFTCIDPTLADGTSSGIASCTSPQKVTTQGAMQPVTGIAKDNAGNVAVDPATVSIDKTPPTISGAPDRDPNANGWYNADVTASFICADQVALSGIDGCTAPQTLHEGDKQSVTGTATDAAGNSTSTTVGPINVDKTPPTLTGAPTSSANGDGWYNTDVSVAWSCGDTLSGIPAGTCPANSTVTGEGNNLSATASVSDKAGNTTSTTVSGIHIDRTAPKTTDNAPSGWNNTAVTVTLNSTDNLSGVKATYYTLDGGTQQTGTSIAISAEGVHTITYWSVDKAGNSEVPHSVTVLIDKTAPSISGAATTSPNANGWYSGPVTVHFTCSDPKLADGHAGSGIATCQSDLTLTGNGANQSVTGAATDNAGNSASATVSGINIDTTGPAITIKGVTDGGIYTLGAVPTPSCTATDPLSGVAGSCTGTVSGGLANGVGTFTDTATATDKAGNTTKVTIHYRVIYGWSGFLQPINDTAHQVGTSTSIFKGGSTVPVKFQLTRADGAVVQTNSAPIWLTPVKGNSTAAAVNEGAYSASSSSGSTYSWDGAQYHYNWGTPGSGTGYYWRIGVTLDDGQTYFVNIGLR